MGESECANSGQQHTGAPCTQAYILPLWAFLIFLNKTLYTKLFYDSPFSQGIQGWALSAGEVSASCLFYLVSKLWLTKKEKNKITPENFWNRV